MIEVKVKDNESIERALRRYKKKYERIGVMKELRKRMYHTQKSVKRREEVRKAARRQKYMEEHGNF